MGRGPRPTMPINPCRKHALGAAPRAPRSMQQMIAVVDRLSSLD